MAAAKTFLKYRYCTPRLVDNLSAVATWVKLSLSRQLVNWEMSNSLHQWSD